MTEIEKLYSEAFENGVDYAIEKMFADEEKKENIFKRGWEKAKGLANKGVEDFKNADWKGKTWRAAIPTAAVAVPTVLAIRHRNKKKAAEAEAEAEKNYSEGFEDGVEYAQRTYGIVDTLGRKFRKLTGRETVKDRILDLKDKAADKWSSLSKLQKAGVIAVPVAATGTGIAISRSGKKKD